MSNFVIGDVHGNWDALQVMLKTLQLRPVHDRLILVGDLVNRGEDSLSVLRWAMSNNVEAILGNHDLHLLARYHGIREQRSGDQLDEVMQAPDAGEMIDWLIRQPFLVECAGWFVVHAGLHPDWHATQVRELGRAARDYLQSQPDFLESILSAHRDRTPFSQLCGIEQVAQAARIFCQLSHCDPAGAPLLGKDEDTIHGVRWHVIDTPRTQRVCFGHAARLGPYEDEQVVCVDSGCGYGGSLSAFCLDDGRWFQQSAQPRTSTVQRKRCPD